MRSSSVRATKRGAISLIALATAVAITGCGADDDASESAEPVGQDVAGSVAPLVQCRDWVEATEAERLATIEDIRSRVNLEGTGVDAPALSDAEATEVFDNGCDEAYAAGYRLHVMYARAAAFQPLRDIAEGDG